MDDLARFLRDRLDEDKRQAEAAMTYAAADWFIETSGIVTTGPDGDAYTDDREVAAHIARHDPARVLAEVDVKRRALDEYVATGEAMDQAFRDNNTAGYNSASAERKVLERIIRREATVHADHPDYREGWRP